MRLRTAIIKPDNKLVDVDVGMMLRIIDHCETLHILPKPGSLFEQDGLFMHVYNEVKEYRNERAQLDKMKSGNK